MNNRKHRSGNILGSVRAEADIDMLEAAFVETSDYRALKDTDDFNFIVGRRGTGKTALYLRLKTGFSTDSEPYIYSVRPQEHDTLALLGLIRRLGLTSYDHVRSTSRVLWRVSLLFTVSIDLISHWKFKKTKECGILRAYLLKWKNLCQLDEVRRCQSLLSEMSKAASSPEELPAALVSNFELSNLEQSVRTGLESTNSRAVFLFDGLDEGWSTDTLSIGILGGLAIAIAGFKDSDFPVHGEVFIRDNIFRSLATQDSDYSRHIEGNTLRLHWDEDTLFNFIANRLRVFLGLQGVESNVRVWNRFAHRELEEREGFRRCLQHTLYRPRDLLVLLNEAAVRASRVGRSEIVGDDIQNTAKQVSLDRHADLMKEYEGVFPGLSILSESLVGSEAFRTLDSIKSNLQDLIDEGDYSLPQSADLAVLGSGAQLLDALYSIGLVGLVEPSTGAARFCHDGARSSISDLPGDRQVAVHPCYWKALDIREGDISTDVLVEIHDDYEERTTQAAPALRKRRLGKLVADLSEIALGRDGATDFENWMFRTSKILFSGPLCNFELHPMADGVQRRDIVASNNSERGFFKRVFDDYAARQVVIEVKNCEELAREDFRQALSYTGRQYGRFVVLVHRSEAEGLTHQMRGWVKELWDQHETLVMTIPTRVLVRCLQKSRNPEKRSYVDRAFSKRLDTFERNYIALRQSKGSQRRR